MDRVYLAFLENTFAAARQIALRSAAVRIRPEAAYPPRSYHCSFLVPYLQEQANGTVAAAAGPVDALIAFPQDYLCSVDPRLYMRVACILSPGFVHPNVLQTGVVCLGAGFRPGTPIGELIWEMYLIVSYRNRTLDERNALNAPACRLLRANENIVAGFSAPPLLRRRRRPQALVRKSDGVADGL